MISALKAELAEVRRVAGVMGRILEGFERGRDLWLPEIVSEEHYEEAHELHGLRDRMLAAMIEWVKLQPGEGR